jgi:uncharacterized protein (TIGR03663 family)
MVNDLHNVPSTSSQSNPVNSKATILVLLILAAAFAIGFRTIDLGRRPMHADESVQAAIFRGLWLKGEYAYNPHEFHGPTMPYATLPSAWLSGAESFSETTETTYRLVPVCFGIAVVLLIWCFSDAIGRPAAISASLLAAISPAMVFYSRYYIHETLLVFFSLCVILFAWRYLRSGKLAWCLAAGAAVGLMQATKETAPLSYVAATAAFALTWLYGACTNPKRERGQDASHADSSPESCVDDQRHFRFPWWHIALGAGAALLTAVVLYSSFFTNPHGLLDAVLTYEPWLKRAGGDSPHGNPWYFFFERLGWWQYEDGPVYSELLILLLAGIGFLTALFPKGRLLRNADIHFLRWLGFYTLMLTAGYTIIPYKTPWCALQFLIGWILLAGVGAVVLVRAIPTIPLKTTVTIALLVGAGQLGWQSYRASFVQPAEPENPWVFAHTSPGLLKLETIIEQFAEAHPEGHALSIKFIWHDHYYWPLPWYLRRFDHVEPWTSLPPDPSAAVVISSPKFDRALTPSLEKTHYMTDFYEIRPQVLVQLWVRDDVWMAHLRKLGNI